VVSADFASSAAQAGIANVSANAPANKLYPKFFFIDMLLSDCYMRKSRARK
jgi:hypothetical protein